MAAAILDKTDLTEANLQGSTLTDAHLTDATMRGAILSDARAEGAQLSNADLHDTDLRGASIRRIGGIDGLRGATMSRHQVIDLADSLAATIGIHVAAGESSA